MKLVEQADLDGQLACDLHREYTAGGPKPKDQDLFITAHDSWFTSVVIPVNHSEIYRVPGAGCVHANCAGNCHDAEPCPCGCIHGRSKRSIEDFGGVRGGQGKTEIETLTVGNTSPSKVTCSHSHWFDCEHEPPISLEEVYRRIEARHGQTLARSLECDFDDPDWTTARILDH